MVEGGSERIVRIPETKISLFDSLFAPTDSFDAAIQRSYELIEKTPPHELQGMLDALRATIGHSGEPENRNMFEAMAEEILNKDEKDNIEGAYAGRMQQMQDLMETIGTHLLSTGARS
jgi:hypothetical protein